jgi:hypothetical protein
MLAAIGVGDQVFAASSTSAPGNYQRSTGRAELLAARKYQQSAVTWANDADTTVLDTGHSAGIHQTGM